MSNLMESVEQSCDSADAPCSAIETILSPRVADLGGFSVRNRKAKNGRALDIF